MYLTNIIKADEANFSPYGFCKPVDSQTFCSIERPLKLGLTFSEGGSFICSEMERHLSTEEYLFSGETFMLLAVSNDPPFPSPRSESIKIFLITPGTVIKLNPGIWHAACQHPVNSSYYYFMAHNDGSPDETKWYPVLPEPVTYSVSADKMLRDFNLCQHDSIFSAYKAPSPPDSNLAEDEFVVFQNDNVCLGNNWRCWITDEDCLKNKGYLYMCFLKPASAFHVHIPCGRTVILLCGNTHLTVETRKYSEPVLLRPGAFLKISARDFPRTAVIQTYLSPTLHTPVSPDKKDEYWFYILSDAFDIDATGK